MTTSSLCLAVCTAAVLTRSVLAHEEPFAYSRGAQSEAPGEWELTQWATSRVGKESGNYLGLDLATELEYGWTDRLQTAVYLTTDYHYLNDARGSSADYQDRNRFGLNGASFEVKYQLLNPFKDTVGVSLYFEPGYGSVERVGGERHDEFELETKLILQKNFLQNRLITVVNYTVEPEFEKSGGEPWVTNLQMEGTAGVAWQLNWHWWVGAETRLGTEFAHANLENARFVVWSAGPTLHYTGNHFFATLAVLPQVLGWPNSRGTAGLHLDEREHLEVRFRVGTEF